MTEITDNITIMKFRNSSLESKNSAIYSAALQDHFMKKNSFNVDWNLSKPKKTQRISTVTKLPIITQAKKNQALLSQQLLK